MVTKTQPVLDTMTVSQARQQFSETLNRVYRGEARVVVEKSGIPVGAIVSLRDLEDVQHLARVKAQGWDAVRRLREAFADVPDDELEREIDNAISNVKSARRRDSREHAAAPVPR
jgi:prevent-host-death family protein